MDRMKEMYAWDMASRQGNVNIKGLAIEVHEFDYKEVNTVIYQENGVTIRSIPAIHAVDGSVSFILTWNGLKFAFSSDTYPNKWWMEYTKDCDLAIHECFAPPSIMVNKQRFAVLDALNVATQVHTSPAMFGKVMSQIKPRMAVGYHVFNDFDTKPQIEKEVRSTYDGPFELAVDYMVFNVTKKDIRVRMAAYRRGHLAAAVGDEEGVRRSEGQDRLLRLHHGRSRGLQGRDRRVLQGDQRDVRHRLRAPK